MEGERSCHTRTRTPHRSASTSRNSKDGTSTSTATRWRFDPTPTGFVLEVEEAWEWGGEHWTCRELFRADVGDEGITQLSAYCTGDWDAARRTEHAAAVALIRP